MNKENKKQISFLAGWNTESEIALRSRFVDCQGQFREVAVEVMVEVAPPPDLMCWIFYLIAYFKA